MKFYQALEIAVETGEVILRTSTPNIGICLGSKEPTKLESEKFWNKHTRAFAERIERNNNDKAAVTPYFLQIDYENRSVQMGWQPNQSDLLAEDWAVWSDATGLRPTTHYKAAKMRLIPTDLEETVKEMLLNNAIETVGQKSEITVSPLPACYAYLYLKEVFNNYVKLGSPVYNKNTRLKLLFSGSYANASFFDQIGVKEKMEILGADCIDWSEDFEPDTDSVYIAVLHLEEMIKADPQMHEKISKKLGLLLMDRIVF